MRPGKDRRGATRGRGPSRPGSRPGPRRESDDVLVYGWHSALAALANPQRRIRRILATQAAMERLAAEGIDRDLPPPVEPAEIDRVAGRGAVHQGIVLLCDPLEETDITDLADVRLVLVLDQVTDPHNVGAILRSAAAFAADAVVVTERHAPGDSAVLAKSASGGLEHVALVRVKNLGRALEALGGMGFERIGLDSEHSEPIEATPPAQKVALVLGAEGKGLRRLTRDLCDRLVRIDMPGAIASLNVSNAAAIALYAVTRPR